MKKPADIALLLGLLLCLSVHLSAQTDVSIQQLAGSVKEPYSELDSSRVATGYLMDRALDLVDVCRFDGTALCDSNYVDASTFRDLLTTMNYAKVNASATVLDSDAIYTSMTSSTSVKLRSALFNYNRLRLDAITAVLIDYDEDDDKLYDRFAGGVWQNPYETDFVFMFAAGSQVLESTSCHTYISFVQPPAEPAGASFAADSTFTAPIGTTTHVCMKLYTDPQEILVNVLGYSMNYEYVSGLSSSKYLAIWCNPDYNGTEIIPDSVEVGGAYYPVATTLYQTINGDAVTIYCFDIKDNPSLQNIISEVRSGNTLPNIVYGAAIGIRSNGSTVESFILPIVSRTMPGPLDPIQL